MIPWEFWGKLLKAFASYLSEVVAETLRASRTQGGPLTDEENMGTTHLSRIASCYVWTQCQCGWGREATCSGLVKIAKPRHSNMRTPDVDTACVSDWIGGYCPADSLMVWFPAHSAPQIIRELESSEHDFRQQLPQWFDEQFPAKHRKQ